MSVLLALYSDSHCCQVGLFTPSNIFYEEQILNTNITQANILISLLQTIYQKAENPPIDVIIAPKGPGSFTSIRVLLATAHGLTMGHQAQLFCPDHFTIFEHYHRNVIKKSIIVALSSRCGDYFVQTYPNKQFIQRLSLNEVKLIGNTVIIDEVTPLCTSTPSRLTDVMFNWYHCNKLEVKPWDGDPFYFNTPSYKKK